MGKCVRVSVVRARVFQPMGANFRFLLGAHALSTARHDFDVCWKCRICVLQNAPPIVMPLFGKLPSCEYSQFTNAVPSLVCGHAIAWFIELRQYCWSDTTVLLDSMTSELMHSIPFIVSNCCEGNYVSICVIFAIVRRLCFLCHANVEILLCFLYQSILVMY